MKKIFIFFVTILILVFSNMNTLKAQSVAINTDGSAANASSILDIKSITKGLLIPRMTTAQRTAIVSPAKGLFVFDTDTNGFWFHNGSAWSNLSAAGTPGWLLTGNTATNPATNFIGTTDAQPLRFRVNNIWAGEIHPTNGNIFLGINAGQANTTGLLNTALGIAALKNNLAGNENVAIGDSSLYSQNGSVINVAVGTHSLFANTTGNANTSIGPYALYSNTNGSFNTGIGVNALNHNISGDSNTAVGSRALQFNNTGNYNTATGESALRNNTSGISNTANGDMALYSNTVGSANTGIGGSSLYNNDDGGFNTAIGINTLANNIHGNENVAIGSRALQFNTTSFNTATGASALRFNSTGAYNTANGYQALYYNTTGSGNTSMGFQTLYLNSIGSSNTANGTFALSNNSTGSYNTANGTSALSSNSTGSSNTANGANALVSNTTANENTAIGEEALYTQSFSNGGTNYSSANTAVGFKALYNNNPTSSISFGLNNTAIGHNAMHSNTTGYSNTAVGSDALYNNVGGNNNISIGFGSGTDPAAPDIYNTISIGNNDWLNGYQNQVFIGNSQTGWIGGWKPWTQYSDGRLKKNIIEDVKGLAFIKKLRPVTYELLPEEELIAATGNTQPKNFKKHPQPEKHDRQSGFIAQEVEKAALESGYIFSGVAKVKSGKELYSLSYESFVVPLVKAMQEQQVMIESLQKQAAVQKVENTTQIEKQQAIITQLQNEVIFLEKRLAALEVKQ